MRYVRTLLLTCLSLLCLTATGSAQDPQAAKLLEAQKEAMKKLAFMDGIWRGPAWTMLRTGKHHITQTERIGPFLGGTLKVIEGKGYEGDGTSSFNALGIISYDVTKKAYTMRSYAMGRSGDYPVTLTDDGIQWEIPAGPGMTIRYTTTVKDGTWKEVGDRVATGKPPVRFFEMELKRVGDTNWPVEGTIQPK